MQRKSWSKTIILPKDGLSWHFLGAANNKNIWAKGTRLKRFLCCLISCIFARGGCNAETGINLGCGCCWRWGWGVKFRCTKVFKATKKWFGMDGGVLQDSTCFDSHGLGGENNWIDTWVLSQPNHVWVRGALCVRREVLRCHPKLRRSPVIPSPTAGESVLSELASLCETQNPL